MPIKNYTTKVDPFVSLGEIQGCLSSHGARKIMIDYDDAGEPSALTFGIEVPGRGAAGFRLPVNIAGILAAASRQKIKVDRKQAMRIAWRNIKDWVTAQMAIIEAEQATIDEVFLPYMCRGDGVTLYQAYQNGELLLTEGERNNEI